MSFAIRALVHRTNRFALAFIALAFAAPVAAQTAHLAPASPVAVVLSGGNIDEQRWRAIVDGPGSFS